MLDIHTSMEDRDIHNMETGKLIQAVELTNWTKIVTLEYGKNLPNY